MLEQELTPGPLNMIDLPHIDSGPMIGNLVELNTAGPAIGRTSGPNSLERSTKL